jgi:2-polyprenyl-6-methoxyphenol hydroxylase-like FAD-dependent oxidoreductase
MATSALWGVRARLRRADGTTNACEATYLAGCDGAHSAVREGLRIGFPEPPTTISFTLLMSTLAAR